MNHSAWLVVLASWVTAVFLTGCMRRYALGVNLLDVPNERSSHSTPTPRGGGVAIFVSFLGAILLLNNLQRVDARLLASLLLGGGAVAVIGFLDDRRPVPASVRFGVQAAAALLAVILLGGVPEKTLGAWGVHGLWLGGLAAVLVIVWSTNLFNFMDGIDGLAGAEAAFMATAAGGLNGLQGGSAELTAIFGGLATASLGFLVWNWPPAKIFMGDVGSGFLGFCIGVLSLESGRQGNVSIEACGILGGVFLSDATVTLLRRMLRGDKWFVAHRMHAYQHWARRWNSHLSVTLMVLGVDVFWLLPWAWLATVEPDRARQCLCASLLPLVIVAILAGSGKPEA